MEIAAYVFTGICSLFALVKAYYSANKQYYKELSFKTLAICAIVYTGTTTWRWSQGWGLAFWENSARAEPTLARVVI